MFYSSTRSDYCLKGKRISSYFQIMSACNSPPFPKQLPASAHFPGTAAQPGIHLSCWGTFSPWSTLHWFTQESASMIQSLHLRNTYQTEGNQSCRRHCPSIFKWQIYQQNSYELVFWRTPTLFKPKIQSLFILGKFSKLVTSCRKSLN